MTAIVALELEHLNINHIQINDRQMIHYKTPEFELTNLIICVNVQIVVMHDIKDKHAELEITTTNDIISKMISFDKFIITHLKKHHHGVNYNVHSHSHLRLRFRMSHHYNNNNINNINIKASSTLYLICNGIKYDPSTTKYYIEWDLFDFNTPPQPYNETAFIIPDYNAEFVSITQLNTDTDIFIASSIHTDINDATHLKCFNFVNYEYSISNSSSNNKS